jgi:hypothetical protein
MVATRASAASLSLQRRVDMNLGLPGSGAVVSRLCQSGFQCLHPRLLATNHEGSLLGCEPPVMLRSGGTP